MCCVSMSVLMLMAWRVVVGDYSISVRVVVVVVGGVVGCIWYIDCWCVVLMVV